MEEPPIIEVPQLTPEEFQQLVLARQLLENPGLAARVANKLGGPIEKGFALLPKGWSETVQKATRTALFKALELAVVTIEHQPRTASKKLHKLLAGASGAIGGAFGLPALVIELPVSTTIMLRSIADVARSEGHDLRDLSTRLACLEVFALGGRNQADDAAESSYWAVRAALAKAVSEAVSFIGQRGMIEQSAPAIVRLVTTVASRFGIIVSEQVAAKAIPIAGAAAGAAINVLFVDHFQDMARGHFIIKRLEKKYGPERIKSIYERLSPTLAFAT